LARPSLNLNEPYFFEPGKTGARGILNRPGF
jgi:hypothetical protein